MPLDDAFGRWGLPSQDFVPGVLDALRFEGKLMGIPAGVDPVVVIYSLDAFQKAGIGTPEADWTLDDLLGAALAVSNSEAVPAADAIYGFCEIPDMGTPIIFTYLMGGQLFDNLLAPTRPTLDSEANRRAIAWYAGLRQTYHVMPDPALFGTARYATYQAIIAGRCGMWLGVLSDRAQLTQYMSMSGTDTTRFGVLPLPRGQRSPVTLGTPFAPVVLDAYAILKDSKHPDAAWQWILFLLDHPEAAGAQLPLRTSQFTKEFGTRAGDDALAVGRSLSRSVLVSYNWQTDSLVSEVGRLYLDAVDHILAGEADVGSALAAAQFQAQALFSQ
jgi:multiple sugar transport system substrate-binding protein